MNDELQKWINSGLDVTPYLTKGFKPGQLEQIRFGLRSDVPLIYADVKYQANEMSMIRQALELGITEEQIERVKDPQKAFFLAKIKYRNYNVEDAIAWIKDKYVNYKIVDEMIDLFNYGVNPKDYIKNETSDNIIQLHGIVEVQKVLNIPEDEFKKRTKNVCEMIEDWEEVSTMYNDRSFSLVEATKHLILMGKDGFKSKDLLEIEDLIEVSPKTKKYINIARHLGMDTSGMFDIEPDNYNWKWGLLYKELLEDYMTSEELETCRQLNLDNRVDNRDTLVDYCLATRYGLDYQKICKDFLTYVNEQHIDRTGRRDPDIITKYRILEEDFFGDYRDSGVEYRGWIICDDLRVRTRLYHMGLRHEDINKLNTIHSVEADQVRNDVRTMVHAGNYVKEYLKGYSWDDVKQKYNEKYRGGLSR